MGNYTDMIKPTDYGIHTYLENLLRKDYQIPTFQREVVWDKDNVKKLWDSIYKFYPIGSILVWKTDLKLQNHRAIGGHIITEENSRTEFQYLLDGQQRTTALLTSLYGGKIEGKVDFDPTLYFDITIEDEVGKFILTHLDDADTVKQMRRRITDEELKSFVLAHERMILFL